MASTSAIRERSQHVHQAGEETPHRNRGSRGPRTSVASCYLAELRTSRTKDRGSLTDGPYSDGHQRLRREDRQAQWDHLPVGVYAAKLRQSAVDLGHE
jgi:hypothetical protein